MTNYISLKANAKSRLLIIILFMIAILLFFFIPLFISHLLNLHNASKIYTNVHESASLNFSGIEGIRVEYSEMIEQESAPIIEGYTFYEGDEKVMYLEVQRKHPHSYPEYADDPASIDASSSAVGVSETEELATFDGVKVYVIKPDSINADIYDGILLFESDPGAADRSVETDNFEYILGDVYGDEETIKAILGNISVKF